MSRRYPGEPSNRANSHAAYRRRPVTIGSAIAAEEDAEGWVSIGCFARDRKDKSIHLLTCGHLTSNIPLNRFILQAPRKLGDAPPQARIGELTTTTTIDASAVNDCDAALIRVSSEAGITHIAAPNRFPTETSPPGRFQGSVRGITGVLADPYDVLQDPEEPDQKLDVYHCGAASWWKTGSVIGIYQQYNVPYPPFGEIHFANVIEIEGVRGKAFATHGDSGSCVLDAQGRVVGMILAVVDEGGRRPNGLAADRPLAYALPIQPVLTTWPNLQIEATA